MRAAERGVRLGRTNGARCARHSCTSSTALRNGGRAPVRHRLVQFRSERRGPVGEGAGHVRGPAGKVGHRLRGAIVCIYCATTRTIHRVGDLSSQLSAAARRQKQRPYGANRNTPAHAREKCTARASAAFVLVWKGAHYNLLRRHAALTGSNPIVMPRCALRTERTGPGIANRRPGGKFMSYSRRKTLIFTVFLSTSTIALAAQAQTAHERKTSSAAVRKIAAAPEGRTDEAIKDRIEHRLATDASVKKYDISVKVNNGAVTLDGSVANDAQKAEAARLAHVTGVTKVENDLKVDKDVDRTLTDRTKN